MSSLTGAYHVYEPYVEFPPARPTVDLLYAICEFSSQRLRYPPEHFPPSGFSYLRRRGKALDRLESWYTDCCAAGQMTKMTKTTTQATQTTLCCAEQAVSCGAVLCDSIIGGNKKIMEYI